MSAQSNAPAAYPPDCQCPAVRPHGYPPLPAEDRRQCRHSLSFRKMAAYPQPVHQRAGHRQYSNTVHHPVNTGRSFTSGHVLVRFSQHSGSIKLYLLLWYRKTCCPISRPSAQRKNPRIGGLQKQRFIECCGNNVKDYVSRGVVSSSGLRLSAICC